jgi:hypothetical protein
MWSAALVALCIGGVAPRTAWPQAGAPQGPEFRVNTYTTVNQQFASVARAIGGDFVVVWSSYLQDGSRFGIYGQRYLGGGTPVGPEFRVNTYTPGAEYLGSVAMDGAGNFVVVWVTQEGQDGSLNGIFGQRYAASGAPLGGEFRVNTYTTGDQSSPSVAVGNAGDFVVVWRSFLQDGSNTGVFGQRYSSSGAPAGSEFRVNTYTTNLQSEPAVSMDPAGNFVVLWRSGPGHDGSLYGVFGQRYAVSGIPLGGEFRVNTHIIGAQESPAVAHDGSGGFVAVWNSDGQDGSDLGVYGQRYDGGGTPLGPEFRVNTHTTGEQGYSALTRDAAGNFVVVWRSYGQDGFTSGVFGQRYDGGGSPVGPEFRVNTYTTFGQNGPKVAVDALGNFVVGWNSLVQDGDNWGVFAQRYGPIVPVELMQFDVD